MGSRHILTFGDFSYSFMYIHFYMVYIPILLICFDITRFQSAVDLLVPCGISPVPPKHTAITVKWMLMASHGISPAAPWVSSPRIAFNTSILMLLIAHSCTLMMNISN